MRTFKEMVESYKEMVEAEKSYTSYADFYKTIEHLEHSDIDVTANINGQTLKVLKNAGLKMVRTTIDGKVTTSIWDMIDPMFMNIKFTRKDELADYMKEIEDYEKGILKNLPKNKKKLEARFKQEIKKAKQKYDVDLSEWNISYNLKSKRIAGTSDFHSNTIQVNKSLLGEFGDLYIDETFMHEVAHAIDDEIRFKTLGGSKDTARVLFKDSSRKPHDRVWKKIASEIGVTTIAHSTKLFNTKEHSRYIRVLDIVKDLKKKI